MLFILVLGILFQYINAIILLLESIPYSQGISAIYLWKEKNYYQIVVPYYLEACYLVPHCTSLIDLINEKSFYIQRKKDVSIQVLQQEVLFKQNQSPAFFVSSYNNSIHIDNPSIFLVSKVVHLRAQSTSVDIIEYKLTESSVSSTIDFTFIILTAIIILLLCLYYIIIYIRYSLIPLLTFYYHRHKIFSKSPSVSPSSLPWYLEGGITGVWKKYPSHPHSHIIYFSPQYHSLLWLSESCYPGIPATSINLGELYSTDLSVKLRWFYAQISQLCIDKRIRIILNRKTLLHDTVLAFATLTHEDLSKQMRLQFNGEPGVDAGGLSREWMCLLIQSIFQSSHQSSNETDDIEEEERYVMRIDHDLSSSTRELQEENAIQYYHDKSLNVKEFQYLFIFTPQGYLPNPLLNYSMKDREISLDVEQQPNCISEAINRDYQFVGRLIGRALFDGIPLGISLNPLIIKAILNSPLIEKDIQLVNEDLYRGLHHLTKDLEQDPSIERVLDLHFSVDIQTSIDGGKSIQTEEVELVRHGKERRVSTENIEEYNELILKQTLYDNYKNSLYFLLYGIYEVIPQEYLTIFTEEELTTILEGEKKIDVDDWRKNTVYTSEFSNNHPVVEDFWSILQSWSIEQRSLLLAFATGYLYPPILGFSHLKGPDGRYLPFCLSPLPYYLRKDTTSNTVIKYQIRARTCFHKLEIPMVDKQTLERVMLLTIQSDNGCFGFDEE